MNLSWTPLAWEQYLYWQQHDTDVVEKINSLLQECVRHPFKGRGKPEPLRGDLRGLWSRRITEEHRLVYEVSADRILVMQCRHHY